MRIPPDATTFDEFLAVVMRHLCPEDCFRVQCLLRDYETETREHFLMLGRREVIVEIMRAPGRN